LPITCVVVADGCLLVEGVQLQEFLIVGPLCQFLDVFGGLVKLLGGKGKGKLTIMLVNPLKPSGHYMYHQFNITQILRSAHIVYLYVLCGSQNKQRLFPYTTLTDWFL
jgi:hypothetical protein